MQGKCKVLGYNVDLKTFDEAINFALEKMKNNRGLHIVTINPEIMALADKNIELANIINNSELVLPESSGIKLALKLKGIKQEQIAGIDFAKELLKKCAEFNYLAALIGAKENVITKAVENLQQEFSQPPTLPSPSRGEGLGEGKTHTPELVAGALNIVYSHNGYFDDDEEIINDIKEKNPKLILCALGAPKQEIFINKCRNIVKNAVYIGVGGSFDVWAGEVQRAPKLFQKLGLEWLYRTVKQPNRIKRIYKTLPMFLFRAIIESVKK